MMKDIFKRLRFLYFTLLMSASILIPGSLFGQGISSVSGSLDDLRKKANWIDKQVFTELEKISKWEAIKKQYNDSIVVRDSLQNKAEVSDSIKKSVENRIKERQTLLANNLAKVFQSAQKVFPCDSTILSLHQGMYGDSILENKQVALFSYVRAKRLFNSAYDSIAVDNARNSLKAQMTDEFSEAFSTIDRYLEQYRDLTENLRKALMTANGIRPEPDASRSQHMIEKYKKEFFTELGKILDPVILSPNIYPYLHTILNKAMEVKKEDPSNDIKELIEKL